MILHTLRLATHMIPQLVHLISQQLDSLTDTEQQQMLYTNEADVSLFTTDTSTQCALNITPLNLEIESEKDTNDIPQNDTGIHSKHKHRDTFGDAHIQYHDFDNVLHLFTKTNIQLC